CRCLSQVRSPSVIPMDSRRSPASSRPHPALYGSTFTSRPEYSPFTCWIWSMKRTGCVRSRHGTSGSYWRFSHEFTPALDHYSGANIVVSGHGMLGVPHAHRSEGAG